MKKPIIPIVFSTDENYVPYCGVAISSLIQHTSQDNEYEIYVFHIHLSEYSIHRLESLSNFNVRVKCVNVSKFLTNFRLYSINHLTEVAFYRIVIPDVLHQYPRVVYLDCDIIVLSDIGKLYKINLHNNVLGAVYADINELDSFSKDYAESILGITVEEYFGSGVMIFNTKQFIQEKIKEKCVEIINNGHKYENADQCVLNIVCKNKVEKLQKEWNFAIYKKSRANTFNNPSPKIIHYITSEKPWRYPNIPYAKEFWQVARNTIFYHEILLKHIDCNVDTFEINLYKEYGNDLTKEKPPITYVFPYDLVHKDSQVILYGAGSIGQRIFINEKVNKHCEIIMWVDKQSKQKNEDNKNNENNTHLSSPKGIIKTVYDYVVIAVGSEHIVDSIKQDLKDLGVPKEKIIWQ
ncbi:MAG: glycosyltransferase family 8 protein [Oscillospiraceae bacterium]|jgi:lipopolysaccharide biosynthesis glycosyltransferase|nr:glycosyltransferase family 8 protein [Oscillospiraceae bacterium]